MMWLKRFYPIKLLIGSSRLWFRIFYLLFLIAIVRIFQFDFLKIYTSEVVENENQRSANPNCSPNALQDFELQLESVLRNGEIVGLKPPQLEFHTYTGSRLGHCRVPKSMQAVMDMILGYLENSTNCNLTYGFLRGSGGVMEMWAKCIKQQKYFFANQVAAENHTGIVIVRDPINRLVSGWIDKCFRLAQYKQFCFGCGTDFECFIRKNYQDMIRLSDPAFQIRTNESWKFENEDHFFPWTWHCRSTSVLKLKYIKYERSLKFYEELNQVLKHDGASETKRQVIMSALYHTKSSHSTFGSKELSETLEFLGKREDLYQLLVKTYYVDYKETDFFTLYPTFKCWLENNEELKSFNAKLINKRKYTRS